VKVTGHACNEPIRCPECIKRFWKWAQSHTQGRPPSAGGATTALSFYEAARLFIEVDHRSK